MRGCKSAPARRLSCCLSPTLVQTKGEYQGSRDKMWTVRVPIVLPRPEGFNFDVVGCGLNMVDQLITVSRHPLPDTKQPIRSMEYSPGGALPILSWVDGGTLDLVRGLGPEVVSSADVALD